MKHFAVDLKSRYLSLVVSDGDVYLYELKKAIESEKDLMASKRRIGGLMDQEIFTWLHPVTEEELLDSIGRHEAASRLPEEGLPPVHIEATSSFADQQHLLAATGSASLAGGIGQATLQKSVSSRGVVLSDPVPQPRTLL